MAKAHGALKLVSRPKKLAAVSGGIDRLRFEAVAQLPPKNSARGEFSSTSYEFDVTAPFSDFLDSSAAEIGGGCFPGFKRAAWIDRWEGEELNLPCWRTLADYSGFDETPLIDVVQRSNQAPAASCLTTTFYSDV